MKYVLDASIAVKWAIPEPDSARALALQDDARNHVHELIAPDSFPVEIAHALTRAERRGLLQQGDSIPKVADILATGPALRPYLPLLARAVELSSTFRLGVYDCLYVALAETEECKVATADQRLVNTFPSKAILLSSL